MTFYTDTHAHIYWEDYAEGEIEIVKRANEAGVKKIIVPGTNLTTSQQVANLVNPLDGVYGAVGIHPSDVKDLDEKNYLTTLQHLLDQPKIIAVGEIGLDYYWDQSFNEKQKNCLREQIELALANNKPIIIHNRNSENDMISVLNEFRSRNLKGVFHCFSGNLTFMQQGLELGFYISVAGVVTFKNSKLKDVVRYCPLDRILTETDAPFLAPQPYRGKRNEPAYVTHTADFLADLFQLSSNEFNQIVERNTKNLFGI